MRFDSAAAYTAAAWRFLNCTQWLAAAAAATCRALQYDPRNRYAAHGIFAGMGIMALSLLLLGLL